MQECTGSKYGNAHTKRLILISKSCALLVKRQLHFSHLEGVPPSIRFEIKPCNPFYILKSSSQVHTIEINIEAVGRGNHQPPLYVIVQFLPLLLSWLQNQSRPPCQANRKAVYKGKFGDRLCGRPKHNIRRTLHCNHSPNASRTCILPDSA